MEKNITVDKGAAQYSNIQIKAGQSRAEERRVNGNGNVDNSFIGMILYIRYC